MRDNPIRLQYNTANAAGRFSCAPFNKIARVFVLIG